MLRENVKPEIKLRSFVVACIVCGDKAHIIGVMTDEHMKNVLSEHLCVKCADLKGRTNHYAVNL